MTSEPKEPTGEQGASDEHEFYDRRSGEDRRSGRDRRRGGRRRRPLDVEDDRRSGKDRRKGPRRRRKDRRRHVDPRYKKHRPKARPVYTADAVAQVQRMLSHVGYGTTCPVCEGSFTLGQVDRRGGQSVRQVTCAKCGRGTVVTNCVLVRAMLLTGIEAMRGMLRAILTAAGHEVLEPPDADAALDLYRENAADVVFMDVFALDNLDGKEFIRRLRTEFSDPRIVVVSPRPTYRTADPSAAATRLGATHVVRTPFTRDDILKVLKEARQ